MAGKGQMNFVEYYDKLGKNLLRIREENNLTQKDIAKKLGITFQQYQKYEKGTNRIPTDLLVIFCEETSTDIREITGCTTGDYENIYKQPVVHYTTTNSNNTVNNVYNNNYNGFFSNLLNMDLSLMKNKVALSSIVISLVIYFGFNVFKFFPEINAQYNTILLRIQIVSFMITFAIVIFTVFGYNLISYLFGYIAFYSFINLVRLFVIFNEPYIINNNMILKASMQLLCVVLTILTFYILKKCKVNLNLPVNKKQA